MRYLEEFRNPEAAIGLAREISDTVTRPWSVMEVCGGQNHSILRNGIDTMLPGCVRLIHGPGCPVCVTPAGLIDKAAAVASIEGVTLCTFGDMLRVPGGRTDLQAARAAGADVRMVYSPIDAVRLAAAEPSREVVFFAVGFETTVPVTATAILQAAMLGLRNFSMINAHVRVPPVLHAVLSRPSCGVNRRRAEGFQELLDKPSHESAASTVRKQHAGSVLQRERACKAAGVLRISVHAPLYLR